MPREVVYWLQPQAGDTVVDGTVGMGGHSSLLADIIGPDGLLIGIDRDQQALAMAGQRLQSAPCRVRLIHSTLSNLQHAVNNAGVKDADRILLDLGVSSLQLDRPERGFSCTKNGPLDMRMDQSRGPCAADLVASMPEHELARIFREFGEERHAKRIARSIVETRAKETINTTEHLAGIVKRSVRGWQRIHPARRIFQALRIAVNHELDELQQGLEAAGRLLKPGGRIVVLTFHSLEDRIVKFTMRQWAASGEFILTRRKVVKPGMEECGSNPRASSAKLRVCEKSRQITD